MTRIEFEYETALDKKLVEADAWGGKSVIFCNKTTAHYLMSLDSWGWNENEYKNHKIYIISGMEDNVYKVIPIVDFDWLEKHHSIVEFKGEK